MAPARSQGIRGEIRDMDGNPVPFSAIYIKELTRGTTCNALGTFSLPLPSGSYTILFRSLGYTEVSKTLEIGEDFVDLLIELPPQTYMIPEVRVSASGEDPAYWIMRKTIGLANYPQEKRKIDSKTINHGFISPPKLGYRINNIVS